ncbi:MAG: alpha/beta fold hydrolase [Ramlibacter sp.]
MRPLWWTSLLLCIGILAGCIQMGDPSQPIPTFLVNAPTQPRRMVVVLPGRADSVVDLQKSGIAQAVQLAWPDADVMLTGVALGYYMQGQAEQRLHDEVIMPARRRGYAQVWLVGASLGGMGAVMYDRAYPRDVDGMVLLAPYLGNKKIQSEVAAAGGVSAWQAPPTVKAVTAANFQQELWRHLQSWSRQPAAARNVWLVYGTDDPFRESMPLIAPLLPSGHVFLRDGGHDWGVWSPAVREVLVRIGEQRGA